MCDMGKIPYSHETPALKNQGDYYFSYRGSLFGTLTHASIPPCFRAAEKLLHLRVVSSASAEAAEFAIS